MKTQPSNEFSLGKQDFIPIFIDTQDFFIVPGKGFVPENLETKKTLENILRIYEKSILNIFTTHNYLLSPKDYTKDIGINSLFFFRLPLNEKTFIPNLENFEKYKKTNPANMSNITIRQNGNVFNSKIHSNIALLQKFTNYKQYPKKFQKNCELMDVFDRIEKGQIKFLPGSVIKTIEAHITEHLLSIFKVKDIETENSINVDKNLLGYILYLSKLYDNKALEYKGGKEGISDFFEFTKSTPNILSTIFDNWGIPNLFDYANKSKYPYSILYSFDDTRQKYTKEDKLLILIKEISKKSRADKNNTNFETNSNIGSEMINYTLNPAPYIKESPSINLASGMLENKENIQNFVFLKSTFYINDMLTDLLLIFAYVFNKKIYITGSMGGKTNLDTFTFDKKNLTYKAEGGLCINNTLLKLANVFGEDIGKFVFIVEDAIVGSQEDIENTKQLAKKLGISIIKTSDI